MRRIRISKHMMPDEHWLVYRSDEGIIKHIDLSGCANNFAHVTGYVSEDNLRAVGYRYEENGLLCYELFNIGHTVLFNPMQLTFMRRILYRLCGQEPREAHEEYLRAFEAALNRGGWKTVERKEVIL